jgi:GT2 family glycosyltransferase
MVPDEPPRAAATPGAAERRARMTSDVAVVIVNYDGERLLPSCLAALGAQTLAPDDVLVADNGSSDGSLALLHARHPQVRVLELGRNLGFAGGANRGVATTEARWVCVLNSDATPAPDWLARLMDAPRDERRTWALGSVLVSAATGRIESAGDQYDPAGFAYKLLRDRPLSDLPSEPYPVFAAPGAAPVFRRDVFDRLGGYEERFFLYYEDVDLAFRAVLAGYHALLVPGARVVHRLGATTRSHARARFYVARNSVWCAARCLPEARPLRLGRRWASELRTNRPRRLIGVELIGRAAGLAGLPQALRERREIQDARVRGLDELGAFLRPPEAIARLSRA